MNMDILNLIAIIFFGRLLQGDGRIIVELKKPWKFELLYLHKGSTSTKEKNRNKISRQKPQ